MRMMGKRGPAPFGYVPRKWTTECAYAVGLFAADGNLSKDGRHLEFTSKDVELAELFKEIMCVHTPIAYKASGKSKKKSFARVQFGNVRLYRWMEHIGFTPRKSSTIQRVAVPDRVFFHFLRGYFDGDGTIYAYWDPRWHSSYMYYISFASRSRSFLAWIENTARRLGADRGKISTGGGGYQLRYAKAGSRKLAARMYPNAKVPHLERKFAKIQDIFTIDGDHDAQVEELVDS